MHEPIVTNAVELWGENMGEVAQQKVFTAYSDWFGFVALSVFNGEGDVSVVNVFDTWITDSTFVNIAAQVFDRIVTIAEVFDISVPVNFPAGIDDRLVDDGLCFKLSEQQVFKSFGKNIAPHQPLLFSDYEIAVRIESASGNDEVDMGVEG